MLDLALHNSTKKLKSTDEDFQDFTGNLRDLELGMVQKLDEYQNRCYQFNTSVLKFQQTGSYFRHEW